MSKSKAVDIADHFIKAVVAKTNKDDSFDERLESESHEKDSAMEIIGLTFELVDLEEKFGEAAKNRADYAEALFQLAEEYASSCKNICTKEEIKSLFPAQPADAGVAGELSSKGAKTLAKLYLGK
jgi:hypothetical protein